MAAFACNCAHIFARRSAVAKAGALNAVGIGKLRPRALKISSLALSLGVRAQIDARLWGV